MFFSRVLIMNNSLKKFALVAFLTIFVWTNINAFPTKKAPNVKSEPSLLSFQENGLTQGDFSISFEFLGDFKLSQNLINCYNLGLKIPRSDKNLLHKWKRDFYELIKETYPDCGDQKKALCIFSIFKNQDFLRTLNEIGVDSLDKLPINNPVANELYYDYNGNSEGGRIYALVSTIVHYVFVPITICF